MSPEMGIVFSTLGAISSLILIPLVALLYRWSLLLNKIAQTVYGENGNNGLKSTVLDVVERVEVLERHLGRRAEDAHRAT